MVSKFNTCIIYDGTLKIDTSKQKTNNFTSKCEKNG